MLKQSIRCVLSCAVMATACLTAAAAEVLGIKGENHSSIGIYIKDLKADTIVFESDADRGLIPASITKAYTSATAMSMLSENFRFDTRVYLTGSKGENGEWNGNIIVKASGDPTLESEFFPKNAGFITEIIGALQTKDITKINGDVLLERVDETHDYAEGPLDCWGIDDVCWAYGAGIFDFNWADNYFGIYPATGKTTSPVPGLEYTVWQKPWNKGMDLIRGIYSDSLIIVGKQYATDHKARINTSMPYPFKVFRAKLIERMAAKDIAVTAKKSEAPSGRSLLVSHKSPRLDDILRSLMVRSDNMFAEGMLRVLGTKYGDRYASVATENELWAGRGLEPQYIHLNDGSGLSRGDCLSPRYMGQMLEWMARSNMSKRYVALFPVAGKDGTMKNFMADTPLKGRLAMKTGSMSAVQTYAGYLVDEAGVPTHVVVVMANNFYCTRADLKKAISNFLINKLTPVI